MNTDYRHEWKHPISYGDLLLLRQRLGAVMDIDPHAENGCYTIRSLYFDTPDDRALRQKLDGVSRREKFRLRLYNGDTSLIHLEKKSKFAGLGSKEKVLLTAREVARILQGDTDWMADDDRPLLRELHHKMTVEQLRPKTLVDYAREPFIYAAGNVRVTMDYHIRTGLNSTDFLNPDCPTVPAGDAPIILEVKWDEFLPDIIRDAIQLPSRRVSAFSKYAQCRIYG